MAEGETAVATLSATDVDTPAAELAWSISGGSDSAHFTLSAAGRLDFASAKDFEDPDDSNSDGAYVVSVQVSDGVRTGSATSASHSPTSTSGPRRTRVRTCTTSSRARRSPWTAPAQTRRRGHTRLRLDPQRRSRRHPVHHDRHSHLHGPDRAHGQHHAAVHT